MKGEGTVGGGTVVAQGGLPAGDAALDPLVADQCGVEARATEDLGGRFAVAIPTDAVALEGVIVDDATAAHAIHGRQGFQILDLADAEDAASQRAFMLSHVRTSFPWFPDMT